MAEKAQTFIEARQKRFIDGYNTLDLNIIMDWFSEDARITNHGSGAQDWTKAQQRQFLSEILTTCVKMDFKTVGVYGRDEFNSWEWKCDMTILKKSPLFPLEEGAKVDLIGVTLFWWDMSSGGDGKITKLVEYNKVL